MLNSARVWLPVSLFSRKSFPSLLIKIRFLSLSEPLRVVTALLRNLSCISQAEVGAQHANKLSCRNLRFYQLHPCTISLQCLVKRMSGCPRKGQRE